MINQLGLGLIKSLDARLITCNLRNQLMLTTFDTIEGNLDLCYKIGLSFLSQFSDTNKEFENKGLQS